MYFTYKDRFRLLMRGGENLICYFTNKKCSPPTILWELIQRCNLTCSHCSSHLNRDKIDTKQLEKTATSIAKSKNVITIITGGEPLIIPNIKEIITILKQHNKIVVLNTNAVLLHKFIEFFTDIKLDYLNISIDSHIPEKHDTIRGQKGCFQIILDNLEALKKLNSKFPRVGIRCVVMKNNFTDMEPYIKKFSSYSKDIKFQPIHNMGHRHLVDKSDTLFDPQDKRMKEKLEAVIGNVTKKYKGFKSQYYKLFPNFLFDIQSMYKLSIRHCTPVLLFSVFIKPSGDAYTCDQKIGNINLQNIEDIWHSPKKGKFLSELCSKDECKHPCWINSSVMETPYLGKILIPLLKLKRQPKM